MQLAEGSRHIDKALKALCVWLIGISQILTCSNTLQHFDVLGMCIFHTLALQLSARVCIHIGVGFGVACSEQKAMREPQLAEQQ